jgi:hypothetical protein
LRRQILLEIYKTDLLKGYGRHESRSYNSS